MTEEPTKKVPRTVPKAVREQLRQEVGFGCPVPGCRNPYLEWHHFDPPWSIEPHHNPAGMIALCPTHHGHADQGAWTKEQLHEMKVAAAKRTEDVRGEFNYLRQKLLAAVGGNFYYETLTIFEYLGQPVIWFRRDEKGYLRLNVRMLSATFEERLTIEDNDWILRGPASDLECPPGGKLIHVRYPNGDDLRIEFFTLNSLDDVRQRYPQAQTQYWDVEFPILVVEVQNQVAGTGLALGPQLTSLPHGGRASTISNMFASQSRTGISLAQRIPGVVSRVENTVFENKDILLDGNAFTGCTFRNCHLAFAATQPFGWTDCTIEEGVERSVQGHASLTLQFLSFVYQSSPPEGQARAGIEKMFEMIRGTLPPVSE